MFGKKKESRQGKPNPKRDLSQFGIFDAPDVDGGGGADSDGDDDFEAELARITGGGAKPKPKAKPAKPPVDPSDLDRMVEASLADVDTDIDTDDENDPNLLRELNSIAGDEPEEENVPEPTPNRPAPPVPEEKLVPTSDVDIKSVLKSRLEMYQMAESNAKAAGDSGKARRFQRGLKTIQDLLKQATAGRSINQEDIPPEVSVKPVVKPNQVAPAPMEIPTDPTPPQSTSTTIDEPIRSAPPIPESMQKDSPQPSSQLSQALFALTARKEEYKVAAVQAKKNGDKENALKLVKILKLMDMAIAAVNAGEQIDINEMPPPPNEYLEMEKNAPQSVPEPTTSSPAEPPPPSQPEPPAEQPIVMATTIDGALIQRLEKYKSVEAAAKAEGNSSKARRFGRIVKQYEDAIKMYKAGKTVDYEELPTPPGFGPLPLAGGGAAKPPPTAPKPIVVPSKPSSPDDESQPSPSASKVRPGPSVPSMANRASGNLANTTLMQKQLDDLLKRQSEFKAAAIAAKKNGDLEEAKEYLRLYKGFDKLLETARGGFPVDMTTLPIPPGKREELEESFEVVAGDVVMEEEDDGGEGELIDRLLDQFKKQLTMCKETRDHHRAMGDVPGTNKFENLALSVQKDIDIVKYSRRTKSALPKYHYERKTFNVVKCHTDLTDNQLEVNIERGINYNVTNPKDVDTYVKFEFPWPQDEGTKGKTSVIKNTDNPEYEFKQLIDIQRSNRQCVRLFKRHSLKLEVYSDRGFLRSDQLIGTINVKLQALENECEIHESYDIMNGRKAVGGKVEVKIRVRNPMLNKHIEKIDEKWLVIDH